MTRTIRWTRRALGRLDQIGADIAQDNPEAAARIVARIVTATDSLGDRPEMGRPGRIKTTRELVLADVSYIIAYRLSRDGQARGYTDGHAFGPEMAGGALVSAAPAVPQTCAKLSIRPQP